MTAQELRLREAYVGWRNVHNEGLAWQRQSTYQDDYLLSQLQSTVDESIRGYDDDDTEYSDSKTKIPNEIKQQILRQLATEVIVHHSLYGKVAVVQSDLQWFCTSLSHNTVYAVLRFFGMPELWISLFRKFLEAPLKMVGNETSNEVRVRRRGVPMAHAIEKLFGEIIFFAMDIAVNYETGMLLYRLHDDLWICGDPKDCAKAWRTMQQFAAVMGLEYNKKKTGSLLLTDEKGQDEAVSTLPEGDVAIGFLKLDGNTGDWTIDQKSVNAHIAQLRKQLAACTSVFSWIQTWNSCIGRFFQNTFGQLANCFGRQHVDSILKTQERMQRELFSKDSEAGECHRVSEESHRQALRRDERARWFLINAGRARRTRTSEPIHLFLNYPGSGLQRAQG